MSPRPCGLWPVDQGGCCARVPDDTSGAGLVALCPQAREHPRPVGGHRPIVVGRTSWGEGVAAVGSRGRATGARPVAHGRVGEAGLIRSAMLPCAGRGGRPWAWRAVDQLGGGHRGRSSNFSPGTQQPAPSASQPASIVRDPHSPPFGTASLTAAMQPAPRGDTVARCGAHHIYCMRRRTEHVADASGAQARACPREG